MKHFRAILIIGIIEILIGVVTLTSNLISIVLSTNNKPPNVLLFVVVASCVSTLIGIGILRFKKIAYQLLLYFSSVVIFSKVLIFLDIVHLAGALETSVPSPIKHGFSLCYHLYVLYYLQKPDVKQIFHIH